VSKEVFVFEVSQQNFGKNVLFNSHKLPVLVEFMRVSSEPCIVMEHLFTELAREFSGQFIFVKVDIDEQVDLRQQYQIENIPTLKVFKDGEMVRQEVGQLQEVEARSLLKDFGVYRESDLMREEARDKHLSGETSAAILQLTEAIKKDPANTRIAMDMVQIFIDVGELEQASALYAKLPENDQTTEMGKALKGQLTFASLAEKTAGIDTLEQILANNANDHDARFDLAICLVSQYQYKEAMEHMFDILEKEPEYKDGAVKEMIIAITNMIAPVNIDLAQEFRRRLANQLAE